VVALPKGTALRKGRYRIQRLLARGGFGFIYLALDRLSGRQVVLKELIPTLMNDVDSLRRFIREGRTMQRLRHPNIARTEAMFKENDNHYIVIEYVSGGALSDRTDRGHKLNLSEAMMVALSLCNALAYLHEQGITHCDLQPGNVLFDTAGHCKLVDLGIAHVSNGFVHRAWQTERDLAIGTVFFMSPEQLDGVRDDPRVDLYALGALLYLMLAGRHYLDFDLRNTPGAQADNVNRVRHRVPVPIPDVPAEVNQVLLRALAKQPDARYPDVDSFRQDLVQAVLAYLSPESKMHLVLSSRSDNPGTLLRVRIDEWPRWIWIALLAINLATMLLVALLLLTLP
jgi:serine/threonine protein kinase